ncbi:MAG: CoB--CoM heterodisulfide reductase iron-sulfur subunit A family protein, partial [Candidatus Bathyarchaeota archaeon]
MSNEVLVIGGGISGITAALDLAEKGYGVYLLEKTPSIGGRMSQLDKTFPTLDCSICILAPKMVEISRHPNIKLYTYSEVSHVQPKDDGKSFKVKIKRKPRYVNEEKCTGCLTCTEKCPVKAPSEFEEKLGQRKAIYIPFPQAVPAVAVIDRTHCLYFQKGVCKLCEKFCPAKAIDFDQEEREETLEVASIILATGFDLIDPAILSQYGYGRLPNVMTSLEFERLLNAAGPTGGKIVKLSDKTAPEKMAFIQCVGSRNVDVKPYCSQICCMYATKEAVVSKEHNPKIDITIFYNDLQASGKAHQELVRRAAEEFQIKYVKGLPSGIDYDFETNKLVIRHTDIVKDKPRTESVDLVVLCPSVVPKKDSSELARMLGISMTKFGFFKSVHSSSAVDTNVPGIYVCGVCEGPKDISHSVAQASAAAARAASHAELVKSEPRRIAPEQKYAGGEPRIGVFVCNCGINIGAVVDVPKVVEFAKNFDAVVYSEEFLFACSKDAIEKIKEAIKEHNLNRVIVASCTPRTHEPLFRATCEEAGLNPYLFEMVNIREHDSWVHSHQPKEATRKAMELVQMAVAKSKLLHPL